MYTNENAVSVDLFSAAEENEILDIVKLSLLQFVALSFISVIKRVSTYEMCCHVTAMFNFSLFYAIWSILDYELRQAFVLQILRNCRFLFRIKGKIH